MPLRYQIGTDQASDLATFFLYNFVMAQVVDDSALLGLSIEPDAPPPGVASVDTEPVDEAPYGYMTDKATGEVRPRKRPGRRPQNASALPTGVTPSLDQLRERRGQEKGSEDRIPGAPKRRWGSKRVKVEKPEEPVPPFRAGPIAKGMNKLYARAGKIIQVMDYEIGTAIIAVTRKESDDDVTVGEAWEELAKVNPRVRRFLLKLITGTAWSQLFMAHAPILLAVIMKDGIKKHIPFMKLAEAWLSPVDQNGETGGEESDEPTPQDLAQMMQLAQGLMGQMANNVPRQDGSPRMPGIDLSSLMAGLGNSNDQPI